MISSDSSISSTSFDFRTLGGVIVKQLISRHSQIWPIVPTTKVAYHTNVIAKMIKAQMFSVTRSWKPSEVVCVEYLAS